jgi:hypothetical protein
MMTIPALALVADTLLVRPVDLPAPWYSVATGILSIVVTLLLLGIAVALLGMARALKGAESNLGGRMQGLADELVPLARNLNQIATQLSEVTVAARGDLAKLSGTIGAVDDAVRDVIDAGEARFHQFGTLLDAVQDEAQATVASATGVMRGVRTGAGSMVSSLFGRNGMSTSRSRSRRAAPYDDRLPLDEEEVRARLAALEAAFATHDAAEERPADADRAESPADDPEDWDDEDDLVDDDDDDDDLDDDDIDYDDSDDDADDDDESDDDSDDDDDDDDDADDIEDESHEPAREDALTRSPRSGGPRIRTRRNA